MNIKKTVAVMLCAVFAAAMLSGCVSSTTVKEKDAGEVTIFVDETIKGAITDAAAAYTKPVREFPEREKAIILIVSDSTGHSEPRGKRRICGRGVRAWR